MNGQNRPTACCDECGSAFIPAASRMANLCPECAHWLYGYPSCVHQFVGGRCASCGWDGSVSAYVQKLQTRAVRTEQGGQSKTT
jgi:predicted RNA-binding Zn-ribbon protein involved in translation (DUF1610 family)